jgi:hypothetical protein
VAETTNGRSTGVSETKRAISESLLAIIAGLISTGLYNHLSGPANSLLAKTPRWVSHLASYSIPVWALALGAIAVIIPLGIVRAVLQIRKAAMHKRINESLDRIEKSVDNMLTNTPELIRGLEEVTVGFKQLAEASRRHKTAAGDLRSASVVVLEFARDLRVMAETQCSESNKTLAITLKAIERAYVHEGGRDYDRFQEVVEAGYRGMEAPKQGYTLKAAYHVGVLCLLCVQAMERRQQTARGVEVALEAMLSEPRKSMQWVLEEWQRRNQERPVLTMIALQ